MTSVALDDASIRDADGNDAVLAGAITSFAGLTVDTTAPSVSSPSLTVAQSAGATAIGITVKDSEATPVQLTATITLVPDNGLVTLSDSVSPLTIGEVLTGAQLATLRFLPTHGLDGVSSSLGYSVSDPAGNSATGSASLAVAAGTPFITSGSVITNSANAVISGTAAPGVTVTLLSGSTPVTTATADAATGASPSQTGCWRLAPMCSPQPSPRTARPSSPRR